MKLIFLRHKYASLLSLAVKYRLLFSMNIIVVLIGAALEGVGIGLLVPVLESINIGNESDGFFTKQAMIFFTYIGISYTFINLILLFSFLILSKYIMLMLGQRLMRMLSSISTREMRTKCLSNILSVSLSFYHNKKLGDLISTIFNSTQNAGGALEHLTMMIKGVLFTFAYLVIAFTLSWELSISLMIFILSAYFLVWPRFKKGRKYGETEKKLMDNIYSSLQDKIGGIKVIKQFAVEKKTFNELKLLVHAFQKNAVKLMDNKIISYAFFEPFLFILMVGLIVVATQVLLMPVASMLVLLIIFTQLIPQFKSINSNLLMLNELIPHYSKVEDLIGNEGKPYLVDGSLDVSEIKIGIEFKQVSFSYEESENNTINNINLFIPAHKTIAIVGPSGAGKSTLIELIARNYDVSSGELLVDGVNIKDLKKDHWKNFIALVDQDCYLFHESIYENILYGKLNGSSDDVLNASRKAYAHDFINKTNDGYNTLVGQRGSRLSGGERQRIALARALIRKPQILILDEATSSLDNESERLVKLAINELKSDITIIVIAHRLPTIEDSDLIIFLDQGNILETGTHDELMISNGKYKRHVDLQHGAS